MTIKLELPKNDPLVLQEMGLALTRIAAALKGGKTIKQVTESIKPVVELPAATVEEITQAEVNAGNLEETVETFTESGPFYWVEKASCTCGQVDTLDELNALNADRCTYDEFLKYDEDFNDVTPTSDAATAFGGNADNLDSDGIPWDKRIHSQGKTKGKKGTFNLRKKPATYESKEQWTEYVEEVKQELRGVMSAPVVGVTPVGTTAEATPNGVVIDGKDPVPPTLTPPPIAETVTPPPIAETVTPPPIADDVTTFQQLMLLITKNNKKINKDQVLEIIKRHGVTAVPLLATRTDLIPQVAADIVVLING